MALAVSAGEGGLRPPFFLSRWLIRARTVILYAILFIPLWVDPSLYMPFVAGKGFAFRCLSLGAFTLTISIWILKGGNSFHVPKLIFISVAYAGISAMTSFFGLDAYRSFWSSYERMDGVVGIVHGLFFLASLVSAFPGEKDYVRYLTVSMVVSVLVVFIGLGQAVGLVPILLGGSRVSSTLGHGFMFSGYLVPHLFLALIFTVAVWKNKWAIAFGTSCVTLVGWGIWASQTRGSQLALLLGMGVMATGLVLGKNRRVKTMFVLSLMVFFGVASGLWMNRESPFVKSHPVLVRWTEISRTDPTTHSRFSFWKAGLEGWKEKPILGWGWETFPRIWQDHEDPALFGNEPWFDRPHNILIDRLSSGGILAFIIYLGLWAWVTVLWWKFPWDHPWKKFGWLGMGVTLFVDLQFSMEHPSGMMCMTVWMAYLTLGGKAITIEIPRTPLSSLKTMDPRWRAAAVLSILALGAGLIYVVNVPAKRTCRALREFLVSDSWVGEHLVSVKRSLQDESFGTREFRLQLTGKILQQTIGRLERAEEMQPWIEVAIVEMEKEMKEVPWDAQTAWYLGNLYGVGGATAQSLDTLKRAHELAPKKAMIAMGLAESCLHAGLMQQAIKYSAMAYALDLTHSQAGILCAAMVIHGGDTNMGEQIMVNRFNREWVPDPRIIDAYASIGATNRLFEIGNDLLTKSPSDLLGLSALGMAYSQAEDLDKTEKVLETMRNTGDVGRVAVSRLEVRMKIFHMNHTKENCRFYLRRSDKIIP